MQAESLPAMWPPSTTLEDLAGQTIPTRFQQIADLIPDQVALQTSDRALTYAELNRAANRLAHGILRTGHKPDVPVMLLFSHDIESFIGMLGAVKAGAFFVPIDPAFPPAHNARALVHSGADLLITTADLVEQSRALQAEAGLSDLPLLVLDDLPPDISDANPDVPVTPDDYAMILYTSGSTGKAKGVLETHATYIVNIVAWMNEMKLGPGTRSAHTLSYSFAGSRSTGLGAILLGHTLLLRELRGTSIQELADWLIKERINQTIFLPSFFRKFLQDLPDEIQFPDLYGMIVGGEAVIRGDVELFRKHFPRGMYMYNIMASTETYVVAMNAIGHDTQVREANVPVGKPGYWHDVQVVDGNLQPVPQGEIGELAVRGPYVTLGYWRNSESSGRRFLPDPDNPASRIYLMGDQARFLPDGTLQVMGRQDFEVKIRGYRVDLQAIEDNLAAHPQVKQAAVRSFEDLRGETRVAAYIKPAPDSLLTSADLRDYLGRRVPEYLIPSYFMFVDSFPTTASGKVDRRSLPVPETRRPDLTVAYLKPQDALQARLTTLWENVLGVYPVGVNDDFFELGGHSLLALELFSRIEQDFGRSLPMDALFHASTVAAFAQVLRENEQGAASQSLVPLRTGGARSPLYLIHPGGGHVLSYYHLIRHLGDDLPIFGLQARGLDGREEPLTTIESMAGRYVDEIRRMQPEGPYHLLGYSLGGKVAYEMARQLSGQGQRVGHLILLDAYFGQGQEMPDGVRLLPPDLAVGETRSAGLIGGLRRDWRAMRGMTLRARAAFLSRLMRQRWNWYIMRPLRGGQPLAEKDMTAARRVQNACRQAYEAYHPGPYAGSMTFVRVSEESFEDSPALWAAMIDGDMAIIDLPGTHRSFLEEPDVQTLAEHLRNLLT